MKISDGYLLRSVAGKNIVVSLNNSESNLMLTLNDTGAFFWSLLKDNITKEEMLSAVLSEYDVPEEEAKKDIDEFIKKLYEAKILED